MPATSRSTGDRSKSRQLPKKSVFVRRLDRKNEQIIHNANHGHPHDDPMIFNQQSTACRLKLNCPHDNLSSFKCGSKLKSHDLTFLPSGTSILASFVFSRTQFRSRFLSFESSHVLRKMFAMFTQIHIDQAADLWIN